MFLKNKHPICCVNQIKELTSQGRIHLETGEFEKALSFFDQALLLNQNDPDLWNYKGATLRSMGRYNEALVCFNKSLEIDPRDNRAS